MQCLACGAEMQLREVVLADIPTMPGIERHTFRCSACRTGRTSIGDLSGEDACR